MNDETSGKTFDQVLYAAFREGFSQGITNIADNSLDKFGEEARTRGRFDDWRKNVLAGAPTTDDIPTDRVGVVGGLPGTKQSGVSPLVASAEQARLVGRTCKCQNQPKHKMTENCLVERCTKKSCVFHNGVVSPPHKHTKKKKVKK